MELGEFPTPDIPETLGGIGELFKRCRALYAAQYELLKQIGQKVEELEEQLGLKIEKESDVEFRFTFDLQKLEEALMDYPQTLLERPSLVVDLAFIPESLVDPLMQVSRLFTALHQTIRWYECKKSALIVQMSFVRGRTKVEEAKTAVPENSCPGSPETEEDALQPEPPLALGIWKERWRKSAMRTVIHRGVLLTRSEVELLRKGEL